MLPIEVEEFLSWMVAEKGRAANTVAAYRRDLTAWCRWLAERGSRTVLDVNHIRNWSSSSASDGRAGRPRRRWLRQLAAIRMLHRYLSIQKANAAMTRRVNCRVWGSRPGSPNR